MDINTRLDGFIIHPLDAFNDKHQNDSLTKFSSTAPNLDGFNVHPLDNFIAQEHNYNNIINYNEIKEENDYVSNNQTYNTGSTFDANDLNNLELNQNQNQDFLSTSTTINNITYNQYENNNISSTFPITYTEPTNYNYYNSTSSDIYSNNQQTNYINTTDFNNSYTTTNYNYSQILPTKFLPPINDTNNINYNTTINLKPKKFTKKIIFRNSSINPPNTTEYKITPYNVSSISSFNQLPKLKRAYTYSVSKIIPVKKIIYKKYQYPYGHLSQNSLNLNQYKYKPTIIHYRSTSSIMKPKTYTIRSYNPNISWNSIALNRTNVTLPTINEYVFMKKPKIILPTKQPIQIIKPVFLQPKATFPNSGVLNTKIVPNLSVIKIEPNISIVPKVTLINQNMNNFSINRFEKYPMDNINGRRRVIL